ncbi:3-oxoacyl-ACP reductase [Gordoniibacillus kamchatkensis]|uniref:3-oxoacyl-ACP reductase n=1 Tax=Gordoniibacillus kamchatkensis TaxID=1590651 RepID=A0ABR5AMM9_9BACL|nr:SDR family oxidoreductase [Paenibacillus sp. VKM B-2647]KIL42256.1 3-oxoacyl-ACP reductase [Paenibacillus sp. VKM B-2647]
MLLQGKTALVTGASRGIGAEIAAALASHGAVVIVGYYSRQDAAERTVERIRASGGRARAHRADVRSASEAAAMVEDAVEHYGSIDIVVNNALSPYSFSPSARRTAWEQEWDDYREQLEGSVHGAYNVCKAAMPHMQKQSSGRIINIVTNLIDFPVVPYHDYTTAKSALLGYTRNLAAELGRFGITVNALAPGLTQGTDSSRDTKEDVRRDIIRLTPLQRLAVPQDIAGAAVLLASDLAGFITGQCLRVDGGLVMG